MTSEFFITSMIVILIPGTGVLYTLAWALGHGFRASVIATLGGTLGIIPHILAATLGLAALMQTSAMAFSVVKYLGVAYLLYMAWGTLRETGALSVCEQKGDRNTIKIIVEGIFINMFNPKLSIFFLSFLPQFIPAGTNHPVVKMAFLGGIFMALTFIVFVIYGAFASAARAHILTKPKVMVWLRRIFATTFGLLSLKLAFSDR